jgi:hypothetical protein
MLTKFFDSSERVRCGSLGEKGSQRDDGGSQVGEGIIVYSSSAGSVSSHSSNFRGCKSLLRAEVSSLTDFFP